MIEENNKKHVLINTNVSKKMKRRFKILCAEKDLTMSTVIEQSIKTWIQANAPISDFTADLSNKEYEIVKGYIPHFLKTEFKVFCTQHGITMNQALYNLLRQWIEANNSSN